MKIYIASKTIHAERWQALRAQGVNIISSWIDEMKVGPKDLTAIARRCLAECRDCDGLIVYREEGEVLKGAFIEMGAALAAGKPVYLVGSVLPETSVFGHFPLVMRATSVEVAVFMLQTRLEIEHLQQFDVTAAFVPPSEVIFPEVKQKPQFLTRTCPDCQQTTQFTILTVIHKPVGTGPGHYRVECTVCGFQEAAIGKQAYTQRDTAHKRGKVPRKPGAE